MTTLARREVLELAGASVVGRRSSTAPRQRRAPTIQDWPTHQFDRGHSGYNPDATGVKSAPVRRWQFNLGAEVSGDTGPIIADNRLFIPNEDGLLWALKADTGEELWRFKMDAPSVPATPAFGDGLVFIGGESSPLFAIDYKTGKQQWSQELPQGTVKGSPTYADGTLYVARDHLFAFDGASGKVKWKNTEISGVEGCVAIQNDVACAFAEDGSVYAVNASTGEQIWSQRVPSKLQALEFQTTIADGRVYVGGTDQSVRALSLDNGETLWTFRPENITSKQLPARSSPAVYDGTVYVGNQDGNFYALNAKDGSVEWTFETSTRIVTSPAIANGVVYFGGLDRQFYALSVEDGSEIWTHQIGGLVRSSCLVSGNRVYFPTGNGHVVSFEPGGSSSDTESDGQTGVVTNSGDSTDGSSSSGSETSAARTGRKRGFFTNEGDGPKALENVFNLTVLGFLLSVAGIIHQMLQGR